MGAIQFNNYKWYEVDTPKDLENANTLFSNNIEDYKNRFGGYWRFNNLTDFCYLENPKFPTKTLKEIMGNFSKELITKYPSNLEIQNKNAAKMFDIDNNKIIVGNGSAELIKELGSILTGKLFVHIPTFNEYIRCFTNCKIIEKELKENSYKYSKKTIIDALNSTDNIVIINPDNPTGSYISYNDMLEILDIAKEKNVRVIYDESFIDFAEQNKKYTLINNDILNKYNNLIVIKSISKSYGIPGLRLGVLATADENIVKTIKKNMGIWNINSLAEYFLEIENLYKKDYITSCKYIARQRQVVFKQLNDIDYIKPYKSQANYIMCKLEKTNSSDLAKYLLENHNILIKDLKGKNGIDDDNYIRIAVKSKEDNDKLIYALKRYNKKKEEE